MARRADQLTASEAARIEAHMIWTPAMVADRLVDAVRVAQTAVKGSGGGGSPWPEYRHSWEDLLSQADSGSILDRLDRRRLPATSHQVSRMEEALSWQGRYLDGHAGPAAVLKHYLRAKATRRSFSKAIRQQGWSKATAYRARDRALALIAVGLMRDGVRPA